MKRLKKAGPVLFLKGQVTLAAIPVVQPSQLKRACAAISSRAAVFWSFSPEALNCPTVCIGNKNCLAESDSKPGVQVRSTTPPSLVF